MSIENGCELVFVLVLDNRKIKRGSLLSSEIFNKLEPIDSLQ